MRYAIYFATERSAPLMELGNAWLGRDPFNGKSIRQPHIEGFSHAEIEKMTSNPSRYGFHGTLKAPFELEVGQTEAALAQACRDFASRITPFELKALTVSEIGGFLALVPAGDEAELSAFASSCVRYFEPFRAPLSEEDLIRRRQSTLTKAQDKNLVQWGYPYIFDEFRFHMTLSNKIEHDNDRADLKMAALRHFDSVLAGPVPVTSFGLYFEENRGAPFRVHTIFQLTGADMPSVAAQQLFEEQA
ncbi:putative phosphonate metabolism protein [Roseibium hamelinense]|uniref:Putative phosphonate metabolism protein n=1 Tax=Roseibium hamelinense TaxID=150831 RepID=A0A562SLT6_9HYPH|nr:DUF1045 domain-containing protein [Roseibium hamelinense]MTI43463.1 DUF1045 domain-containing protein [Roseibium hamelinense]TWI81924.1 putative phosphonate metabolism protein [Roseibium hamelinense]